MMKTLALRCFRFSSVFPRIVSEGVTERTLKVIHSSEVDQVPEREREDFKKNNKVEYSEEGNKYTVIS